MTTAHIKNERNKIYWKHWWNRSLYYFFSYILVKAKEVWTKENGISLGRMRTDLCFICGCIAGPLKRWKRQFMHKKCVEFSRCLSPNSRITSCLSKLAAWEVLILLPLIQRNILVSLFHRFCVCVCGLEMEHLCIKLHSEW